MDPTDLSDDQLDQLATQIAPHLPTGTHGGNVILSRRQFAAAASGVLSTGALMALGVDEASAQAAGQQGTASSPNDMFAYNLDVQNGAEFNGNDLTGVGSLSTDEASVDNRPVVDNSAKTLYIDPNGGSDDNPGTESEPLQTIQEAWDRAGMLVNARVNIDPATVPSLPVTYDEDFLAEPADHAARDTQSPRTSRTIRLVGDTTTPSNVQIGSGMVYSSGFSSPSIEGVQFTRPTPYADDGFGLQFVGGGSAIANDISFASGVTHGVLAYDTIASVTNVNIDNCTKGFGSKRFANLTVRSPSGTASAEAYDTRNMGRINARGALAAGSPQFSAVEGGIIYDRVNGRIIHDTDSEHELGASHVLPNSTTPGSGGNPVLKIGDGSNGGTAGFYVDSNGNIVAQNEDGTTTTL